MLTMDKYLDYHWSHEKIETSFGDYEILRAVLGVMNFFRPVLGVIEGQTR